MSSIEMNDHNHVDDDDFLLDSGSKEEEAFN